MTYATIRVQNGAIILPKELKKTWQNASIFIEGSSDTISIKRLSKPELSFSEMMNEFQKAAKKSKITKENVEKAINLTRKKLAKKI